MLRSKWLWLLILAALGLGLIACRAPDAALAHGRSGRAARGYRRELQPPACAAGLMSSFSMCVSNGSMTRDTSPASP